MINIRKLVAFDIAAHSPRFIVAEFAIAVAGIPALGLLSMFRGRIIIGWCLLGIGVNYIPLLIYAVSMTRNKSATQAGSSGLKHKAGEAKRYILGQLILLGPFLVLPVALYQEIFQRKNAE